MRISRLIAVTFFAVVAHAAEWRAVGPGGGGAMFAPTVSPHDARAAAVACDMTGVYVTRDAGASWRMSNLHGAVSWFAYDPHDAHTLYAYGVGLYRSADDGATWTLVYPAPRDVRAYVARGDHAEETIVTRTGVAETIEAFAIDPREAHTLYAAFVGEGRRALRVSHDRGDTWRDVGVLSARALALQVDKSGALYVATRDGVLVTSGGQWTSLESAPYALEQVSAGFDKATGAYTLYAVTARGAMSWSSATRTWRELAPQWTVRAIATSLHDAGTAYLSYSFVERRWFGFTSRTRFGVAVTRDGGAHWATPWSETPGVVSANVDIGGWLSRTFGPEWGEQPLALGVAPNDASIVYATDMGRTLRSTDYGAHWRAVYTRAAPHDAYTTTGLNVTTTYGVHADPRNARHLFMTTTDTGLWQCYDAGASWSRAMRGVPAEWSNTAYWLAYDVARPHRIYAAFSSTHDLPRPKMWRRTSTASYRGGVCRSDDNGATWIAFRNGLPEGAATHVVVMRDAVYATLFGRGVYKSTDAGEHWSAMNTGLPSDVLAWRLTRAGEGTLYLVVARRSEDGSFGDARDGALYRSTDGAAHWSRLALPNGVNGPMGLVANTRTLVLAAWGRATRDATQSDVDGGVYRSTDGGATWAHVLERDMHIYDITADATTLYATGFESTVWRSGDGGLHWSAMDAPPFKWFHRVVPDSSRPGALYITTYGGGVWHTSATARMNVKQDRFRSRSRLR